MVTAYSTTSPFSKPYLSVVPGFNLASVIRSFFMMYDTVGFFITGVVAESSFGSKGFVPSGLSGYCSSPSCGSGE